MGHSCGLRRLTGVDENIYKPFVLVALYLFSRRYEVFQTSKSVRVSASSRFENSPCVLMIRLASWFAPPWNVAKSNIVGSVGNPRCYLCAAFLWHIIFVFMSKMLVFHIKKLKCTGFFYCFRKFDAAIAVIFFNAAQSVNVFQNFGRLREQWERTKKYEPLQNRISAWRCSCGLEKEFCRCERSKGHNITAPSTLF